MYHRRPLGAMEIKATDWTASNARLGILRPRATNPTHVKMQINVIFISYNVIESDRRRHRLRVAPREGFMLILR